MSRFQLRNIPVDTFDKKEALRTIGRMLFHGKGGRVFTPNVDHVVLAEHDERFAGAYRRVTISLADGMPVVWASHLIGPRVKERVAGSDFLFPLLQLAATKGYKVFWLGSNAETLNKAHKKASKMFPGIQIVGMMSPFVSSAVTDGEVKHITDTVIQFNPDIIIVALGAPKQEIFIDKASKYFPDSMMFGLGASLDFLAGDIRRAPRWIQKIGMEWFWRLCREPRRLWKRYLRDFQFPVLVLKQYVGQSK
jgi:N-acetylglucosaminyldiphosphoundecaprenol N-acetyl-beta-D-mannosaminyltransferase